MTRCAFSRRCPFGQPCRKCVAFCEAARANFLRDVFFGHYDRQGYTPADRQAQRREAA